MTRVKKNQAEDILWEGQANARPRCPGENAPRGKAPWASGARDSRGASRASGAESRRARGARGKARRRLVGRPAPGRHHVRERNMPSPREGRASLSSVALAKEDARPRCPCEGRPGGRGSLSRRCSPCPVKRYAIAAGRPSVLVLRSLGEGGCSARVPVERRPGGCGSLSRRSSPYHVKRHAAVGNAREGRASARPM